MKLGRSMYCACEIIRDQHKVLCFSDGEFNEIETKNSPILPPTD